MDAPAKSPELTEAQKQARQDRARARDIEAMMNTAGWKSYEALLNVKIAERTSNLFEPTPEGGRDSEQHNKGAVYGLILARDLPSVIVASMKDQRKSEPASEE